MRTTIAALAALAAATLGASGASAQTPAPSTAPAPAAPAAAPAAPALPAWYVAADPQNILLVETNKGRIVVEMRPDIAPQHVERVKTLTRKGYYDNSLFYRVLPGFVAQTGDKGSRTFTSDLPNLKLEAAFQAKPAAFQKIADYPPWTGGPGGDVGFVGSTAMRIDMPLNGPPKAWALHCPGAVSFAHGADPNSANSQIFFVRGNAHGLDSLYSVWGRVVSGQEVVQAINDGEPPANPDRMTRVRVLADVPAAERPRVMVIDPKSPVFASELSKGIQSRGAGFNVCDVAMAAYVY
jgi:peptidylprolyl isomerase